MRYVFLIPDYLAGAIQRKLFRFAKSIPVFKGSLHRIATNQNLRVVVAFGGTLNLMRHCQVAREQGADAVLATVSGQNNYGSLGAIKLAPFIKWSERRPSDICVLTDIYTRFIDSHQGPSIAYLQNPELIARNFGYKRENVTLWTDSPFMLERCREAYPGKPIEIVPNVVDCHTFPFVRQSDREPGLLFAFPRKGPEFIAQTMRRYQELGGRYWKLEKIDGLAIGELGKEFKRPQAFLASGDVEGCALPPQESMASGVVVVGKDARGANFSMRHRETAMIANTPEDAAAALRELEEEALREKISMNAHRFIERYFPENEPAALWRRIIAQHMTCG